MSKSTRLGILSAVAAILAVALPAIGPGHADAVAPRQAFVRVNKFYVLYTYPVVPYLDKNGVLMVGLAGIVRCLSYYDADNLQSTAYGKSSNGQVKTDASSRIETLTLGGHTLVFSSTSSSVQVDGKDVSMEAPARWDITSQEVIVPVASLAQCLGLESHWDAQRRVFTISSRYLTGGGWGEYGGELEQPQALKGLDTASLVPRRVIFHSTGVPGHAAWPLGPASHKAPWLMIEMADVSGTTITFEDLNVAVLYPHYGESPNLDGGEYQGRFRRGPDGTTISPSGVDRLAVALQTDRSEEMSPMCVVSCPVSGASPSQF